MTNKRIATAPIASRPLPAWQVGLLAAAFLSVVLAQTIWVETAAAQWGRFGLVGLLLLMVPLRLVAPSVRPFRPHLGIIGILFVWIGWRILLACRYDADVLGALSPLFDVAFIAIGFGIAAKFGEHSGRLIVNAYLLVVMILAAGSAALLLFSPGLAYWDGSGRFSGLFRRPSYAGFALSSILIWCAYAWYAHREMIWRVGLGFLGVIAAFLLFKTGVRGAWIACAGGLIAFYSTRVGIRKAFWLAAGMGAIFVGLVLVAVQSDELSQKLRMETRADGSIDLSATTSGRFKILELGLYELRHSPAIWLVGRGEEQLITVQLGSRGFTPDERSVTWHNPLALILSDGLPGYILFYAAVIGGIIYVNIARKRFQGEWVVVLCIAIKTAIISISEPALIVGHVDHMFFWCGVGAAGGVIESMTHRATPGRNSRRMQ